MEPIHLSEKTACEIALDKHNESTTRGKSPTRQNRSGSRNSYRVWYRSVYLKSAHWKLKRYQIIKRGGGKCEVCLSKKATSVHHKNYDRLWKELDSDLLAICRTCHEDLHGLEHKEVKKAKKQRKRQRSPLYKPKR